MPTRFMIPYLWLIYDHFNHGECDIMYCMMLFGSSYPNIYGGAMDSHPQKLLK